MIQKKICMLGSFSVGKTSLVRRFVTSIFSEKYLTTVGVKIDKKILALGDREVMLMLWDLSGEDEFNKVKTSYFRGASGYLVVIDGTRPDTLDVAIELQDRVEQAIGPIPFIALLNKNDLEDEWKLSKTTIDDYQRRGWTFLKTSAKTGNNVEYAFHSLAERMLEE